MPFGLAATCAFRWVVPNEDLGREAHSSCSFRSHRQSHSALSGKDFASPREGLEFQGFSSSGPKEMGDHASELGPIAFDFNQGAAKLGLFGALRECFLEQTTEPVLLALNPEDVLNLLQSAGARDVSGSSRRRISPRVKPDASSRALGRARCSSPTRTPMKCRRLPTEKA